MARLKDARVGQGGCDIERWSFAGKDPDKVGYCKSHFCLVKRCVVCGEEFHTKRKQTRTCSDKCRKALSRKPKTRRSIKIKTKAGIVEQEVFW